MGRVRVDDLSIIEISWKGIKGDMMTQFVIVIVFSILVEAIVELVLGDITSCPKWVKKVSSIAIGIFVCIVYKIGIIGLLGVAGGIPVVDYVLTGIMISRGSNYLSDLLGKIKSDMSPTTTTPASTETTATPKV